jgi:UDP:flavonoid glycosyltransferase YjiC (YdhE family)
MFHGIPSVCIPLSWEEKFISERVVELGIGLEANMDLLKLGETIQTVIENQK